MLGHGATGQFAIGEVSAGGTPTVFPGSWFVPLSEPRRFKIGRKAASALQQFLAHPPQLRPTPTTTGILSAIETKDTLLASAQRFNPPAAAEIGVVGPARPVAEFGVTAPQVAGARIAITIL